MPTTAPVWGRRNTANHSTIAARLGGPIAVIPNRSLHHALQHSSEKPPWDGPRLGIIPPWDYKGATGCGFLVTDGAGRRSWALGTPGSIRENTHDHQEPHRMERRAIRAGGANRRHLAPLAASCPGHHPWPRAGSAQY